jgi:hypothetical protein
MFGHGLIILPVIGFVFAAGAGVLLRARRAREEKRLWDKFTITGQV